MRDPEGVLSFIEDFKGKNWDSESETEQEIWDVYGRFCNQSGEGIKREPLPLRSLLLFFLSPIRQAESPVRNASSPPL